jgi:circadian clock protein KaiC
MMDLPERAPRKRIETGIPGLDSVLQGGLLAGSVYLLEGRPGTGKTTLANQICFHRATLDPHVLYVTLFAESHDQLLLNLGHYTFFDPSLVPSRVSYVSGSTMLEASGLKGLSDLLRHEVRARSASVLVLDGLAGLDELPLQPREIETFVRELQATARFCGCTVLLLTALRSEVRSPEFLLADGVLELRDHRVAKRSERELEITKFRGSTYLEGGHSFEITDAGLRVHPRIESLLQNPPATDDCSTDRVSTGIPSFDRALSGGWRAASSTVLFGATGAGKTVLGLHFLACSSRAQPGLLFGFYETPERLSWKARSLGLDLDSLQQEGALEILWQPPTERVLDALAYRLLEAVRKRGVKRLFIDGIDGFAKAAADPSRLTNFFSALTNELRVRGVTTMYTSELHDLFSTQVGLPMQGISSLVENIILLRFVECRAELLRLVTIVKQRDSAYDGTLRELRISSRGASLGDALRSQLGEFEVRRSLSAVRLRRFMPSFGRR